MFVRQLLMIAALLGLPGTSGMAAPASELDSWFGQLRIGMWVKVDGEMRSDGALDAEDIKIYPGELDEWEVSSNVTSVDVTQMTLQTEFGLTVQANERTDLQGPKGHRHIGFTLLAVGDRVETEGQWHKDGTFLAEEIEIEKSKRLKPDLKYKNEHEVTARIESVDQATHSIVLLGVRIYFSAETRNKSLLLD
jgi:hypothetical protein